MPYRSSLQTDLKILKVLALKKEFSQYDLPKNVDKDYRTILRHLKVLKKKALVRVIRTEESMMGGKDKNILSLTKGGVISILPVFIKDIDVIARNYPSALLTLAKWDLWLARGLRGVIIKRLRNAYAGVKALAISRILIAGEPLMSYATRPLPYEPGRRTIDNSVLGLTLVEFPMGSSRQRLGEELWKEQLRIWEAANSDPDLKRYIDTELDKMEERHQNALTSLGEWRSWWETCSMQNHPVA